MESAAEVLARIDGGTDYVIRTDGEGFEVPSGELYRLACCDCGLVHDLILVSHDGLPIGVAARANDEETDAHRALKRVSFHRKFAGRMEIRADPSVREILEEADRALQARSQRLD